MYDYELNLENKFSSALMYSLTQQKIVMNEMKYLYEQTELLKLIALRHEKQREDKLVQNQKCVEQVSTIINSPKQQKSLGQQTQANSKVTLFSDCKIKRIQQQDEILSEINKKCSINCYNKVKQLFEGFRNQLKLLKKYENEIELNKKIDANLLIYRQQNDKLKIQIERMNKLLNDKNERQKLKILVQKNMNKQNIIIKNQKNLLIKQKRMIQMRKKLESIYDIINNEINKIYQQTYELNNLLRQLKYDKEIINQKIIVIKKLWENFSKIFKEQIQ